MQRNFQREIVGISFLCSLKCSTIAGSFNNSWNSVVENKYSDKKAIDSIRFIGLTVGKIVTSYKNTQSIEDLKGVLLFFSIERLDWAICFHLVGR